MSQGVKDRDSNSSQLLCSNNNNSMTDLITVMANRKNFLDGYDDKHSTLLESYEASYETIGFSTGEML